MKKLLAILLAAATMLSMSVSSFAANIGGEIGTGATYNGDNPGRVTDATGSKSYKMNSITDIYDADGGKLDWNRDNIEPGATYYVLLSNGTDFNNWAATSTNARISSKKIKNGSLIKTIGLTEKRLDSGTRKGYIQVVLNNATSADEIRVDFSVTVTAKKDAGQTFYIGRDSVPFTPAKGDVLTLTSTIYVSNENVDGGDTTVEVGKSGAYVKPIAGQTNEVIFEDSDVLAVLTFDAASNPSKFFAKLTTNWTTTTIKKFQNTDAVIRTFYPATIDARSRARLALANPYDLNRQNPAKVWIYSMDAKGNITDISASFKYNTELDAYTTYVRTLGTYVISNVKVK